MDQGETVTLVLILASPPSSPGAGEGKDRRVPRVDSSSIVVADDRVRVMVYRHPSPYRRLRLSADRLAPVVYCARWARPRPVRRLLSARRVKNAPRPQHRRHSARAARLTTTRCPLSAVRRNGRRHAAVRGVKRRGRRRSSETPGGGGGRQRCVRFRQSPPVMTRPAIGGMSVKHEVGWKWRGKKRRATSRVESRKEIRRRALLRGRCRCAFTRQNFLK